MLFEVMSVWFISLYLTLAGHEKIFIVGTRRLYSSSYGLTRVGVFLENVMDFFSLNDYMTISVRFIFFILLGKTLPSQPNLCSCTT